MAKMTQKARQKRDKETINGEQESNYNVTKIPLIIEKKSYDNPSKV
jgi:hypothetical protein